MSVRMGWKGFVCAVGALVLGSPALAQVAPEEPVLVEGLPQYVLNHTGFAVQLRPGVSTVVTGTWYQCLSVSSCGQGPRPRRTVVAIPGLSHTAASFAPMANEFCGALQDGVPTSLLAIDLPGHGLSADPSGLSFSDLSQEDYAVAVEGVLSQLSANNARPVAALGHSMGGLVLQRVQARLVSAGSSLMDAYGISSVALLAPVPVAEVAWPFADSGAAEPVLASFVVNDPVRGLVARVPAAAWPALFFTATTGTVAAGTPAPADLEARGYTADEPLVAGLQLVGSGGFSRPSAPADVFAPVRGTQAAVITLSEDGFYTAGEHEALYQHLTGDGTNAGLVRIISPEAVHDLHVAQPEAVAPFIMDALLPQPYMAAACVSE